VTEIRTEVVFALGRNEFSGNEIYLFIDWTWIK
jgi:hypothetical protein